MLKENKKIRTYLNSVMKLMDKFPSNSVKYKKLDELYFALKNIIYNVNDKEADYIINGKDIDTVINRINETEEKHKEQRMLPFKDCVTFMNMYKNIPLFSAEYIMNKFDINTIKKAMSELDKIGDFDYCVENLSKLNDIEQRWFNYYTELNSALNLMDDTKQPTKKDIECPLDKETVKEIERINNLNPSFLVGDIEMPYIDTEKVLIEKFGKDVIDKYKQWKKEVEKEKNRYLDELEGMVE